MEYSEKIEGFYIESDEQMKLLEELPYHTDSPYDPYEGLTCYVVTSKLEVGTRAYMVDEANGIYVVPGIITEIITVSPADKRNDIKLRNKHFWTDSFLIGNTRYHVGVDMG